jgi:hypothetical protein
MTYYYDQVFYVRWDGYSAAEHLAYIKRQREELTVKMCRKTFRKKFYFSKSNRILSKYLGNRYPPALQNAGFVWDEFTNLPVNSDDDYTTSYNSEDYKMPWWHVGWDAT